MRHDTWPTHEALRSLTVEMGTNMATNQSECFARIFHQIALAAPPEWAVRCAWISAAINGQLPIPLDRKRLNQPVSHAEAFLLGFTGTRMSLKALVLLACVLDHIEHALGADHMAILPIRWEKHGALQRTRTLSMAKAGEADTWHR